jgi:hypothetical protein
MSTPRKFYEHTAAENTLLATTLQSRYDRLAIIRLVIFLAWVAAMIILIGTNGLWALGFFIVTVPLLAWGVRKHLKIKRAAAEARVMADLTVGELLALDHDFSRFDDGENYLDQAHQYALDLDVFGPKSIFQLINRTVTAPGSLRLAEALQGRYDEGTAARTRVQAKVLEAMPDWCLRFRTIGEGLDDDIRYFDRLLGWLDRPNVVGGGIHTLLLFVTPVLTIASLAFMFLVSPWQLGVLGLLPAAWMLRKYRATIEQEHTQTAEMGEMLSTYAALLDHIRTLPAASSEAADVFADAARLGDDSIAALHRLSYLISQLDVRYNPFVIILEIGGLWSLHWLRKLDQWREEHRTELPDWLAVLAETDTQVSWATLRYNNPDWTDPEFTDDPIVEATGLGHPLLPATGRVTNDFSLGTDGHIHLITGSNMAGKSTWLRTVGVNLILANAGSSICGRRLRLRPNLEVWTSMRTQDDLSESTSSFYAELKRLKSIIEAVSDADQQVFFLLDEILKGTNSRDRHTGSRALIRQLIRERGAGIIATHDLELAALESEPGSRVENYAMEVQTEGDQLTFDYKLHPGVCQSFNATALMARMGIDIPPEEIRLRHD